MGTKPSRICEPAVVGSPLVDRASLTVTGTPQSVWAGSGPAASSSRARASAPSASTRSMAAIRGSVASMRVRQARAASTALISFFCKAPATAVSESEQISVM